MKTYGNIILMTAICVVIFWAFMALRPAQARNIPPPDYSQCTGSCDPKLFRCVYYYLRRHSQDPRVQRGIRVPRYQLPQNPDYISLRPEARRACGANPRG